MADVEKIRISGVNYDIADVTARNGLALKQDIFQLDDLDNATGAENIGRIVQYVGETDSNYTKGYFYLGRINAVQSTTIGNVVVTVEDTDTFEDLILHVAGLLGKTIDSIEIVEGDSSTSLIIRYYENGSLLSIISQYPKSSFLTNTGLLVTGTVDSSTSAMMDISTLWERLNVQPTGSQPTYDSTNERMVF